MLDPAGREIPKDYDNRYIGNGTPKIETIVTEAIVDPLTDESGTPIEAGTVEALLLAVRAHFGDEPDVEVLAVEVLETRTVRELTGAQLQVVV